MKVFVDIYSVLDPELLKANVELTDDPFSADMCIYFSTFRYETDSKKAVMIQVEPPLDPHRLQFYRESDRFHTVFTFNPTKPNEFAVTDDVAAFPYGHRCELQITRSSTTLGNRLVYFAGNRNFYNNIPNCCGNINLYPMREAIVERLIRHHGQVYAVGSGWSKTTKPEGDWERGKVKEIDEVNPDFVLCIDNSDFPNYISEKIHNGFQSDRAVIYLGNSKVESFIPEDAFINANRYFNRKMYTFNHIALRELIQNMSQQTYDAIIHAARKWRSASRLDERYAEARTRLTKRVLSRIL